MGRRRRGRDWVRARRERLEARVADGQARLEQARARSPAVDVAVDAAVGVLRREPRSPAPPTGDTSSP